MKTASRRAVPLPTLLCASLFALLGAGCSLPMTRQPPQIIYRLQAPSVVTPACAVQPTVIRLLPVGAAPGLDGPAMLYSGQPARAITDPAASGQGAGAAVRPGSVLMPYRDSRWLAPPADLIRATIGQTLSRQPWVSAVEMNAHLAPAAWTLHCELTRLEHDIRGSQGTVRLGLTCQLLQDAPRRIAAHWHFDAKQAVAANDAAQYAAAAQTLLDRMLRDMVGRVRKSIERADSGH